MLPISTMARVMSGGTFGRRHPDPTTFIEAIAMWALINGASFLFSDPTAPFPIYSTLRSIGIPIRLAGSVCMLDACMLGMSVVASSPPYRATVATISGALWMSLGLIGIIAGTHIDVWSIRGIFSICCGLGCFNAASQWAYVREVS